MEKLTITKDKVLKAASKCDTAKQTLKILFSEVFEEEKTYRIGDRFKDLDTDEVYILSRASLNKCLLINLSDGNLYNDFQSVKNDIKITKKEFEKITGGDLFKFIKQ